MKLMVCDDKKIKSYNLTNIVEDSFIIDYFLDDSDIYETISLKRENNVWTIEDTSNINIVFNNNDYNEYGRIMIRLLSMNKDIMIYFMPDIDEFTDVAVSNLENIKIGSVTTCNIIFKNNLDNLVYAEIVKQNNNYVIKATSDEKIYIENYSYKEKVLEMGDVIYIQGLKIIWMNTYFKVSKFNGNIQYNGLNAYPTPTVDEKYVPSTEYERNLKLYSDNQVFFHTPRLQLSIDEQNIELDLPPEEDHTPRMPLIFTVGTSAVLCLTSCATGINALRSYTHGVDNDLFSLIFELVISIAMISACLLLPILVNRWEKNNEKKRKKLRNEKYTEYLNKKRANINKIIKDQEEILHNNNTTLEEIEKRISSGSKNIWIREIVDDDFLNVRLGSGEMPASIKIQAPKEGFSMYDDDLRDQAMQIANTKNNLVNVPITISMSKDKIVTFIFNCEFKESYINSLMLQLLYYYSPEDLKIAMFTNQENNANWDYLKYLPHTWSVKHDRRFYATNENESLQLSSYLDTIYEKRINDSISTSENKTENATQPKELFKNYSEYYLIITDNFKEIKNIPIIEKLLNSNKNVGFSLLIFDNNIKNLPSRLDKFVDIKNSSSGIYSKNLASSSSSQFKSEYLPNLKISDYSNIIANIPVNTKASGYNLPTNLSFLELFHAGKISHLNITKKWMENDPTTSLFAPVGVKENGKMIGLDLHEKAHGPHGLIAGSTGSGKSEFIITYILSMAINYSPKEVQFILIDYKGGGLAGAFENRAKGIKIPHLVGTITNLDTSEMNRTLVSIQSELQRRQIKFNEAREILGEGTIDIYKYQKLYREGKIKEPMAHLFVICDEFAELKQQQPDFMDELISTSRIGRSLGVHLILATQKPSGVVDDQIWSNARFKVCLKVQNESDSIEMLKKDVAATIKETGRFYLQVGNDELFEYGQSAYSGAKYIPVEHIRNKVDDSIDFLNNDGEILRKVNDVVKNSEVEVAQGEQLTNIVKYLYDLAIKDHIEFNSLWLPSLQKTIYMQNLTKKYNYTYTKNDIKAVIGEYDKPSKQKQGLYELDLNGMNTAIFGIPNSGKENFLYNIIYSCSIYHTPKEVNFYILDFGSESLNPFSKLPHVGDYITANSKEMVSAEFEFLEKEIRKRKELFAEFGGSYDSYIKNSGQTVPLIITILNSYESFMENCYDYEDAFNSLLREGSKYGIVFITTAVTVNSIRSTILDYYNNKVILQTNESYDYRFTLGAPSGLIPSKNFGRGIAVIDEEPCEFQSAIITTDNKLNEYIKSVGKNLQEHYKFKAPSINVLPQKITLNSMFKYAKQINKIPIGYGRDTAELYYYDFYNNKISNIIGNNVTNDIEFMCSVIDLIDSIKTVKLNIFDFITCIETDGNASYYNISFADVFKEILENKADKPTVNIIIGIGNKYDVFDDEEAKLFDEIMSNIDNLNNQSFIIFDNNDRFSKITEESWYSSINKNYIWQGKYIDSQNIFDISNINNYDLDETMDDLIYVINEDSYEVIKGVGGSDDE